MHEELVVSPARLLVADAAVVPRSPQEDSEDRHEGARRARRHLRRHGLLVGRQPGRGRQRTHGELHRMIRPIFGCSQMAVYQ